MDLDDIKTTDPALVAAYQKFTTRVHMAESFSFWFDKGNNEAKYEKYIKKGAPKEVNLAHTLVEKFDALAAKKDYNAMNPLFVEARGEVKGMLDPRMPEFLNSPEYDAYVLVKKAGNIKKALTLLGVTGPNAVAMEKLLKEYAVGTPAEKLAVKAKMAKIAKAEQITLALKNAGLV
jgi:hypothetical protein